jgi:nitrilase
MTKIAVIQEPPVYLNLGKSMARAVDLIAQAARKGCALIVFLEAWLAGYPTFVWRLAPGSGMTKTDALYARLLANSVDRSKEGLGPLQQAAKEHGVVVVMGYQEVDGSASGSTIFNSCAVIDADGRLANNHRKLMPTRLFGLVQHGEAAFEPGAHHARADLSGLAAQTGRGCLK